LVVIAGLSTVAAPVVIETGLAVTALSVRRSPGIALSIELVSELRSVASPSTL
jgi:hypothetical protein